MQDAVARTWTSEQRWHIGDLAWGRNALPDQEAGWATALWEDSDGAVRAWGWVELPGHLDLHVDPAWPELADEVLAWFEDVASGGVANGDVASGTDRSANALDTEGHLIAAFKCAGYRPLPEAPFFRHCLIELDDALANPHVPDGYRLRAVHADEAGARAAVHRAAWRPSRIGSMLVPPVDLGDADSSMTTESYRSVMSCWPYRRALDLVVETSGGAFVAQALGWLDEANRVGLLEPVGTDPRHVRRGLGAAVSLACLHAMRQAGATRAVVCPRGDDAYPIARRLYFGLGFRPGARTVTYGV